MHSAAGAPAGFGFGPLSGSGATRMPAVLLAVGWGGGCGEKGGREAGREGWVRGGPAACSAARVA